MIRCALVLALATATASADVGRPPPLAGVGLEEHVGMKVPLDLTFNGTSGKRIQLGELFGDDRPVLMVLAYMRCKMLCSLVLRGATDAIKAMPLALGRDYHVITVAIDPNEDAASARMKRDELLARAGHPDDADAWSYLVGAERPIRALADRLGFHYAWDPQTEQYAHPAVVFVLTPDGTISRYLQGVQLDPGELAAALVTARDGKLSDTIAGAVLSCFHFDPAARAHREAIQTYLRVGGALVCLLLGGTVIGLFVWERKRRRA